METVVADCAAMREVGVARPMPLEEAIDLAMWLRRTPDIGLSSLGAARVIEALLRALLGEDQSLGRTFILMPHDRAAHRALALWIHLARENGARSESIEQASALLKEWMAKPDAKWPV